MAEIKLDKRYKYAGDIFQVVEVVRCKDCNRCYENAQSGTSRGGEK